MMRVAKLASAGLPILAAISILCLATPAWPAEAAQWPHYKLGANIDPATHRLSGVAEVTLPAAMAGQSGEFVLAANFSISASNPPAEKSLPPPNFIT